MCVHGALVASCVWAQGGARHTREERREERGVARGSGKAATFGSRAARGGTTARGSVAERVVLATSLLSVCVLCVCVAGLRGSPNL